MKTQKYVRAPKSLSEAYILTAHSHAQYMINLKINFNIIFPSTSKVILEISFPHVLRITICKNTGVLRRNLNVSPLIKYDRIYEASPRNLIKNFKSANLIIINKSHTAVSL
jgi:hypothetical protein